MIDQRHPLGDLGLDPERVAGAEAAKDVGRLQDRVHDPLQAARRRRQQAVSASLDARGQGRLQDAVRGGARDVGRGARRSRRRPVELVQRLVVAGAGKLVIRAGCRAQVLKLVAQEPRIGDLADDATRRRPTR